MTFDSVDVLRSINKMKGNCSSGPDGLPQLLLKKLKCQPLAMLYNQFMCMEKCCCSARVQERCFWFGAELLPNLTYMRCK